MILSGIKIAEMQRLGDIKITPFDVSKVNPNSYNLTLSEELLVYTEKSLDMKIDNPVTKKVIPDTGLWLQPNKIYLGRTNEKTFTDKFVPMLEGRSSIGRLGLDIHISAGFGDIGFNGYWTLELRVVQPLKVYPNVDICQIFFHTIEGNYDLYKSDKYQNNNGVQASKMFMDFKER